MKVVAKSDEKWYDKPISRRDFIKKAGMMGAGAMMAPSIMKLLFGGTLPKDALAQEEANQAIHFMVSVSQASPHPFSVRSILLFWIWRRKIWRLFVVFSSLGQLILLA